MYSWLLFCWLPSQNEMAKQHEASSEMHCGPSYCTHNSTFLLRLLASQRLMGYERWAPWMLNSILVTSFGLLLKNGLSTDSPPSTSEINEYWGTTHTDIGSCLKADGDRCPFLPERWRGSPVGGDPSSGVWPPPCKKEPMALSLTASTSRGVSLANCISHYIKALPS